MATHSSILAWRIPGMGEPVGLPSMGSHRVGHDWLDLAAAAATLIRGMSHYILFLQMRIRHREVSASLGSQNQLAQERVESGLKVAMQGTVR